VEHTEWDDLDVPVREAIQRRTGTIPRARPPRPDNDRWAP